MTEQIENINSQQEHTANTQLIHSLSTCLCKQVAGRRVVAMSAYLGVLLITSVLAVGSIWTSGTRHWPAANLIRRNLAQCPETRELRFTIINVEVERASAVIHRPVFNPQKLAIQPQTSRRAA